MAAAFVQDSLSGAGRIAGEVLGCLAEVFCAMKRTEIELVPDQQDVRIAHFAAAAILLSVAESGAVVRGQTLPSESWRPRQFNVPGWARSGSLPNEPFDSQALSAK